MRRLYTRIMTSVVYGGALLPAMALAADHTATARSLLARINSAIIFPLMMLMTSVAVLVFLWGAFKYVSDAADESGRQRGRQSMLYGVIGLVILLSAYTILQIAAGTFGISVSR